MSEYKNLPKTDTPSLTLFIEAINRTGYDRDFRDKFIADPRSTLAELGFAFPESIELILLIDEPTKMHITLPEFDDRPVAVDEDDAILNDRYAPRDEDAE